MNPLSHASFTPDGAPGADIARPGEARHNLRQREVVDDALALMQAVGTLSALEYLKLHAIEGRIIARVLLEPRNRRSQLGMAAA